MGKNGIDWQMLGNRIAEMRISRGITQMELAEMTGLSLTHIGYIEQGKRHGKLRLYSWLCHTGNGNQQTRGERSGMV